MDMWGDGLNVYARKKGLTISTVKSEVMHFNSKRDDNWNAQLIALRSERAISMNGFSADLSKGCKEFGEKPSQWIQEETTRCLLPTKIDLILLLHATPVKLILYVYIFPLGCPCRWIQSPQPPEPNNAGVDLNTRCSRARDAEHEAASIVPRNAWGELTYLKIKPPAQISFLTLNCDDVPDDEHSMKLEELFRAISPYHIVLLTETCTSNL
eukprot:1159564-Pelagomonas_calceolata.AAC.10